MCHVESATLQHGRRKITATIHSDPLIILLSETAWVRHKQLQMDIKAKNGWRMGGIKMYCGLGDLDVDCMRESRGKCASALHSCISVTGKVKFK